MEEIMQGSTSVAQAAAEPVQINEITIPQPRTDFTIEDTIRFMDYMLQIVYTIFFIATAFFILFAAWQYLSSGGEPEKVKKAQQRIIYAVVAIIVAMLSFGAASFVENLLNKGIPT